MTLKPKRSRVILYEIPIIPNKVNIYRRGKRGTFQARIKLENGDWHRISLKVDDFDIATEKAIEQYFKFKHLKELNLPQITKTCTSVARYVIDDLEKQLNAGRGKSVYRDYIKVLNNYFIPFFGKYYITNITQDLISQFDGYREEIIGRRPAISTLNTHNSAFNRVFMTAYKNGWILKSQLPVISTKGVKSQVRPTFTVAEYREMAKEILKWRDTGRLKSSRLLRELLSDYVFILSNTGIRHGTEMMNLKWKHLDWYVDEGGKKYLQITVCGKTGNRQLIARHGTISHLRRIKDRFENLKKLSFDELIASRYDEYVVRLRDGTRPKALDKSFDQFLTKSNLLYGSTSEKKRTLYSLRHFYATTQLMQGRNIHSLAKQMGTSVGMIEKHYSKLTPMLMAEEFAGDD